MTLRKVCLYELNSQRARRIIIQDTRRVRDSRIVSTERAFHACAHRR